ncbi:hypothetical protein B0T19DRAFT_431908 [Cercophora scortea]|uniref:Methyltransferase n=1 Tax=Cercophora scortea TaxID=314031 RepID=A0AAE0I9Y6_9PEZI|nr:hypothetical protein B0T19DRAFT_431908 [Cercophora scortea]
MDIQTTIRYLQPSPKWAHEKPYECLYEPKEGTQRFNYGMDQVDVTIRDIRGRDEPPTLEKDGFQIVNMTSNLDYGECFSREKVTSVLIEQIRPVLASLLGTEGIYFHEAVIRIQHPNYPNISPEDINSHGFEQPVISVHVDYTPGQLDVLVKKLTGVTPSKGKRIACYNVWKPLKGPVRSYPLAFCSARTVKDGDLVATDAVYNDGLLETYLVYANPQHEWWYLSLQEPSELVVFRCTDTTGPPVPHTAFLNPKTCDSTEMRESIEFRVIVVY